MKNVLITGSQGFIGKNLTRVLRAQGHVIHEFTGDITDLRQVDSFFASIPNVDVTFHFAGISSPTVCTKDPELARKVNTEGAFQFASKVVHQFPLSTFVFPSTGQVYAVNDGSPFSEESPLQPVSFYAETKLKAEELLRPLADKKQLKIVTCRLFNHTHKTQDAHFFLPSLHQQILNGSTRIQTGNLNIIRDFGALQDLMAAFQKLLLYQPVGNYQVFNICSGTGKKLRVLAEELALQLNKKVEWVTNDNLLRKDEPMVMVGNSSQLQKELGWTPTHAATEKELIHSFLADF